MAIKGYLIISLIFFFINTMIATNCFSSLPYRQLRKVLDVDEFVRFVFTAVQAA
ncbi:hypothetical protein HMPREF0208_04007 [Citrobacter koseri]|nr:hypothetical protein HMPREF0208_04007 [Citrobacter koseri]